MAYILESGGCETGAYKDYVYNIEVEDYRTYFVDEIGFCVKSIF
ncbi:MAG: hypothetical protein EOO69_07945 [Moraxellaceae bacterium]|nr:MAG: hypothetical protein EOO69_07945 [Moraxellaceae bacterium]